MIPREIAADILPFHTFHNLRRIVTLLIVLLLLHSDDGGAAAILRRGNWSLTVMSLQFSQDPLSKREKQAIFRKSLDDQRRMKQESSSKPDPFNTGNQGYHVPGLAAALPDDLNAPSYIPGLDEHQPVGGYGYAPRFEASRSPQQDKQPYMSAVSIAQQAVAYHTRYDTS